MKKKITFYIIIILYLFITKVNSLENIIVFKIDNKIITTIDIKQEEELTNKQEDFFLEICQEAIEVY